MFKKVHLKTVRLLINELEELGLLVIEEKTVHDFKHDSLETHLSVYLEELVDGSVDNYYIPVRRNTTICQIVVSSHGVNERSLSLNCAITKNSHALGLLSKIAKITSAYVSNNYSNNVKPMTEKQ